MKDDEKRVPAGSSEPQHLNKCIVRIYLDIYLDIIKKKEKRT